MNALVRQRNQQRRDSCSLLVHLSLPFFHMLMRIYAALASLIGDERVETELLPQCWEQISDAIGVFWMWFSCVFVVDCF